ncbi:MAG: cupin domain-containing protein [Phycisphaerales bacterium JB060]
MTQHTLHTLADLPTDQPMPLIDRRRIMGQRMMISEVVLHPGFEVASHSHENEQFVVMLEGRAEFTIGGQTGCDGGEKVIVSAGQVLELPPNLPHACRALERCRILDLFSPVSEKTGVDAGS